MSAAVHPGSEQPGTTELKTLNPATTCLALTMCNAIETRAQAKARDHAKFYACQNHKRLATSTQLITLTRHAHTIPPNTRYTHTLTHTATHTLWWHHNEQTLTADTQTTYLLQILRVYSIELIH